MMVVATTAVIWLSHLASHYNYYWTFQFIFVAALALSRYVLCRGKTGSREPEDL
jgi:hypothetical protein